jgi:5'-3' exonuclease
MNYLIVDAANTFFRARHAAHRHSDSWEKVGFAVHTTLGSINKCFRDNDGDHVVICFEGRSWRKDIYPPYKKNRAAKKAALTDAELEEDKLFWEGFEALQKFLVERTNCTTLQHEELEADDLIAGWIQSHPLDRHVIVSTDSDFHQLLAENVQQYNGVNDELHTLLGIFDRRGKPVLDKKTKEAKIIPDPQWLLFEKIMRGDTSDNIFSAFPGVRKKGTKKKVGLLEAYADRNAKGFNWNNMMLQKWVDHNGEEHRVLDDYKRNKILIDLNEQPEEIKVKIYTTIMENSVAKDLPMIGAQFLKFCGKYELVKLSEQAQVFSKWLSAAYKES